MAKLVELTEDIKITMFTTIDAEDISSADRWRITWWSRTATCGSSPNGLPGVEQITANSHVGITLTSNDT